MQWNANSPLADVETGGHIYWCLSLVYSELLLPHDISVLSLIKKNKGSFISVTPFSEKNKIKKNFSAHLVTFKITGD